MSAKIQPVFIKRGETPLDKAMRGEGSRGGRIIGHTRSGKPIYGSHAKYHEAIRIHLPETVVTGEHGANQIKALKALYPKYTSQDHWDAAAAHEKEAKGHREKWLAAIDKNDWPTAAIHQRKLMSSVIKQNSHEGAALHSMRGKRDLNLMNLFNN